MPETIETYWLLPIGILVVVAWLDGWNRAQSQHIQTMKEHLAYLRGRGGFSHQEDANDA